jgi:hypothetical protein
MWRLPRLWLPVALVAIGAGCSLPVSGEVEVLAQDDHRELLNGTTSTTVLVAEPDEPNSTLVKLFFIGPDDKIEFIERSLPAGSVNNDVLNALENGPIDDEIAQFETLQTFIPLGLSAEFGPVDEERGSMQVIVDPAGELRERVDIEPESGRLAIKQLVCTVLNLNLGGVQGIEIYDGGEDPIPLSDDAAQPIIGPAQKEDFDNCTTGTEERAAQLEEEGQTTSTSASTSSSVPTSTGDGLGSG